MNDNDAIFEMQHHPLGGQKSTRQQKHSDISAISRELSMLHAQSRRLDLINIHDVSKRGGDK